MEPLVLGAMESFYVGGTPRTVESSAYGIQTQISGAMYVRRLLPAERRFMFPVVFIHGGMHTGATWETTPDGREGWETLFVRRGFETLVVDQAWRGRSAPDLTALNPTVSVSESAAPVFTCGLQMGERFTRGGDRFPTRSMRHYGAQLWPDFAIPRAIASGAPGLSDPRALAPLVELIDGVGRVVLVTHSQGGHLGWMAALARPRKIAAILAVEPAVISPGLDDPDFPDIPISVMWGDNLPAEGILLSRRDVATVAAIAAKRSHLIQDLLPEHGIVGNGHMLMMEDNSAELAKRAMDWLESLELCRD